MSVTFQDGAFLLLLLLLPLVVVFFAWRERVRAILLRRVGDPELVRELMPQASRTRRIYKAALWLCVVALLIIALARPVWGVDADVIETQGVAVMVVLDVSNSMLAEDILPSRLERARLSIRDLFVGLEGNEIGLILFAGEAFVQFPLTGDAASAETFLNAASTESITRQGTAIQQALQLALDSFDSSRGTAQVVILITDGESTEGDPLSVVDAASERGVIIYTLGYGDPEGAPIPLHDDAGNVIGYKEDRAGNVVSSALNETLLQEFAERTNGLYQRASASGVEVQNLITLINEIESGVLEQSLNAQSRGIERFAIFVALALVALSLEILLPDTGRSRERKQGAA